MTPAKMRPYQLRPPKRDPKLSQVSGTPHSWDPPNPSDEAVTRMMNLLGLKGDERPERDSIARMMAHGHNYASLRQVLQIHPERLDTPKPE